ncbi:MAG: sugar phosphate isomerase/epimerase [Clostridia bacterium]|nr:sugar phosphate isomerase/epimerase [Clostridia bacterium]
MIISASSRFYTIYPDGVFTPFEMLEFFSRVGFGGCDYDLETVPDMEGDWRAECAAIADRAAQLGISLDMGHLPFHPVLNEDGTKNPEKFAERMMIAIEAASIMGVRNAVIHPHGKTVPYAEFEADDCLRKCIAWTTPFAERAAQLGVSLSFENMRSPREAEGYHRWGSTAEEIASVADYFGMGNCWDFGHAHTSGVPQGDSLRYLGKRLTALHVNDNHAGGDEHLLPYFGTIDWNDSLCGLRDSGYDRHFNYECRMIRQHPEVRVELGHFAVALAHRMCDYSKLKG